MVVNSDIAIAEKRGLITEVGKTTLLNASSLANDVSQFDKCCKRWYSWESYLLTYTCQGFK